MSTKNRRSMVGYRSKMTVNGGGPLQGIKVVELGVWIAGPAAALILSDWGADVVKIEPRTGDPNRSFKYIFGGEPDTNPVLKLETFLRRSLRDAANG